MKKFTQILAIAIGFAVAFGNVQAQETIGTIVKSIKSNGETDASYLKSAVSARDVLLEEGFDVGGDFPPSGWTLVQSAPDPDDTWVQTNPSDPELNFDNIDPASEYSAMVPHEPDNDQDEWLITPEVSANGEMPTVLDCYIGTDTQFLDGATITINITTDDGATWTKLWDARDDLDEIEDWQWNHVLLDLDAYADSPFKIGFQYVGVYGNLAGLDGVKVKAGLEYLYNSDFEDYAVGEMVALDDETGFWTTWSNDPGSSEDAPISDEQASSPTLSAKMFGSSTDLLFLCGNKKTGKYQVNFDAYIAADHGGYYNFQHFEDPGVEWAYQVYFGKPADKPGYAYVGNSDSVAFDHPFDTWFAVETIVDLDADWAEFYVDGVMVAEWQWSLQSFGDPGTNQLGGINYYAAAPDGVDPLFYFDDMEYIELVAGLAEPILDLTGDFPIFTSVDQWEETTENFIMGNAGEADLVYDYTVTFPAEVKAPQQVVTSEVIWESTHPDFNDIAADPDFTPFVSNTSARETVLHYDSDSLAGSLGSNAGDYQWTAAVRFPADMLAAYRGMNITKVSVFINDPPLETKLQIYGMGGITKLQPGGLMLEQPFTPIAGEWNEITLDNPLYVDGQDLWVGYYVSGLQGTFVPSYDEGPEHTDGQWLSFGGAFSRLFELNSDFTGNWHIRAYLDGWNIPQWLEVDPTDGTLTQDEYLDVDVNINTANLEAEPYFGQLILRTNDSENEWVTIDVYIDVTVGVNEFGEEEFVMVYPNPAKDILRVKTNGDLQQVRLMNSVGQVIFDQAMNTPTMQINISDYDAGIYFIQVETNVGTTTQKIVIR